MSYTFRVVEGLAAVWAVVKAFGTWVLLIRKGCDTDACRTEALVYAMTLAHAA